MKVQFLGEVFKAIRAKSFKNEANREFLIEQ